MPRGGRSGGKRSLLMRWPQGITGGSQRSQEAIRVGRLFKARPAGELKSLWESGQEQKEEFEKLAEEAQEWG